MKNERWPGYKFPAVVSGEGSVMKYCRFTDVTDPLHAELLEQAQNKMYWKWSQNWLTLSFSSARFKSYLLPDDKNSR